jgi:hypothetical protein
MTASPADAMNLVKDVGLPFASFVSGFLISRWTLTKKDRKDIEQKNFENTSKLIENHDATYRDYTAALTAYADAPLADGDKFIDLAITGDRYFLQLNLLATAIISDKVDPSAREQILLPRLRAAVVRTLPHHYDALRMMADKHGFKYRGELRRSDHGAIYAVAEKYGPGPEWSDNPEDDRSGFPAG